MTGELQAQAVVRRAATTADLAVPHERHLGVRTAVALLVADQPAVAWNVLARSVERQARMSGIPGADLGRSVPR